MKRMIPLLLALLLLTGCGGNDADGSYQQITQEEAKEMMDTQEVIILDVREQDEYDSGHIPSAVLLPVDSIDEDVTHAYDQINDLSEELEDLEADLYEDEDAEDEEDDSDDETEADDDDDNADVAGEPYYEVACPACGKTVYVSEDDLDAGEAICPSCKVAFEVALEDPEDDEAAENDGPVQYEVTCPACGTTSVVDEEALLDGDPVCPSCGKPLDFEVTEE